MKPASDFGIHPGNAVRGVLEPITVWVFADCEEEFTDRCFDAGLVDFLIAHAELLMKSPQMSGLL